MKAIAFTEFGGPDVLRVIDLPTPEPGPGQVRVRVRAAGFNAIDAKLRSGSFGELKGGFPAVPGIDVAGVVDAVGDGAEFGVGDEVLGWADSGSYAEYAVATRLAIKPGPLDWAQAAALPVGTETSQRVLEAVRVTAGDTVLIHGAAGLVGAFAVQLALRRGAVVIGSASPTNHEYVRSLGATPVAYGEGLVGRVRELAPNGIDAVVDAAGSGALPASIELRGGTSRIVTIADGAAFELGVAFSSGTSEDQSPANLVSFAALAAAGELIVTVARTFQLERAAEAHAFSAVPHPAGKIVLIAP